MKPLQSIPLSQWFLSFAACLMIGCASTSPDPAELSSEPPLELETNLGSEEDAIKRISGKWAFDHSGPATFAQTPAADVPDLSASLNQNLGGTTITISEDGTATFSTRGTTESFTFVLENEDADSIRFTARGAVNEITFIFDKQQDILIQPVNVTINQPSGPPNQGSLNSYYKRIP